MGDLDTGGKPADNRALEIKIRRMAHEITCTRNTAESMKIDVLEKYCDISRLEESIQATLERVETRGKELEKLKEAFEND